MTPTAWIALATLALLFLGGIGAGVWYTAMLVGALPGMIAKVLHDHEMDCANHEPNSRV
jgi:hypothetical protein